MMNKRLISIFVMSPLVISLYVYATPVHAQRSAQNAIKILQKKYDELNDFSADLLHVREFLFSSEKDTSSQKISLLKENYFKIETSDMIFVTDGITVKDYSLYEKRVTIDIVDNRSSDSFLPKDFLFEFPERYNLVDYRESSYQGKPIYILALEPKNPDEELMQYLEVQIDPADSLVKYVKYTDFNENENIYILDNYHVDTGLAPEQFDIHLPDDTDIRIIDLRSKK